MLRLEPRESADTDISDFSVPLGGPPPAADLFTTAWVLMVVPLASPSADFLGFPPFFPSAATTTSLAPRAAVDAFLVAEGFLDFGVWLLDPPASESRYWWCLEKGIIS